MKPKQIIIGLTVALCGGLGIFALLRSHRAASAAEEEAAPPTVVSVQLGTLQRMTLHRYLTGYGTVAPAPATTTEPAADAPLAAPVAGVVTRVNVVEGQQVKKGEVLVELNSGAMTVENAEQEVTRQRQLYAQQNTALKNLQNAEAQLALLRVTAPLSGTVARVNVKPGAAVDLNTVVAEVIDLNRLAVRADIPVSEAGELKPGDEMQVLTEPPVTARLSFISPTVDTNSSTVLARAALPVDSGLRPGQFVPLRIVTAARTNCLVAPEASVVTDISGSNVIALVKGDEAAQTPVQTGFRENGWMEINGPGLQAGDSVVTVGAYGLPKKTKVRVANSPGAATSQPDSSQAQ